MKKIGILGGMGWEASASYYRIINQVVRAKFGGHHSARIVLDSLNFHPIANASNKAEYALVRNQLIAAAQRLETAGADLLLMACNTVHRFANNVQKSVSIPLLHIVDTASALLLKDKHKKIGLLGTNATMSGNFYQKKMSKEFSLEIALPTPEEQKIVHCLIINKLATGVDLQSCATLLQPIIESLKDNGCSAVLLACTELALAYNSSGDCIIHRQLPLYDTAAIHARAAADIACSTKSTSRVCDEWGSQFCRSK